MEKRHVVIHLAMWSQVGHDHPSPLRSPHENLSRASDGGSQRWVELPVAKAIGSKPEKRRQHFGAQIPTFAPSVSGIMMIHFMNTYKISHTWIYSEIATTLYTYLYINLINLINQLMIQVIYIYKLYIIYTCHLWGEGFMVRCLLA